MTATLNNINDLKLAEKKTPENEAQLRRQQKLDSINSLTSGIAHEFNNLLQVIQGYTQFAQESLSREASAYQDLQKVLDTTEQATQLSRQLLDFSRSDEAEIRPCSIDETVQELVCMLRPLLPKNIELQLQPAAIPTQVQVHAQQLQQALLNLCLNARDAMPEGGDLIIQSETVTLSQSATVLDPNLQPGKYVCLTVTDTGTGISQEIQQHIFEPFYTTKEFGQGTGLGLAVTFDIIQQAGGHIECHSEMNHGTTFQIHLPVCAESS